MTESRFVSRVGDGSKYRAESIAPVETGAEAQARLHPSTAALLRYFEWNHLQSERLQAVSIPFHRLAYDLADRLPGNAELTTCLRKLLEAKDCAVRAALTP